MKPDVIKAVHDGNLFRSYVTGEPDGDLKSWSKWMIFLRCLYGLRLRKADHATIKLCTGREPSRLPKTGFSESLLLCGRRSGKSKISALVAASEAILSGKEKDLSTGEIPMVAVLSPTRVQSRIIHSYMEGVFRSTPMLENELAELQRERFTLRNGVEIAIITGDPRHVRGFSLISCIIDEIAMFGLSEESKVRSDTELIRAIRPSLVSTGGRLLAVGTPYAARGYAYQSWKNAYGNNDSDVLCWNAASLLMNPSLPKKVVQRAVAADPTAARVEYAVSPGLFREDVETFIPRRVVEALVVPGRLSLPPQRGIRYASFADVSGGVHDDACLAIGHRKGRRVVVLDCLERYKSPHVPAEVVARMCEVIRRYGCKSCVGDCYSAEWSRTAFRDHGISYNRASRSVWRSGASASRKIAKPKSELYANLLPRLHSAEVELLDDDTLVTQLCSLERRVRSGGRDSIDHPPSGHDDLSNCLAGVVDSVLEPPTKLGVAFAASAAAEPTDEADINEKPPWMKRHEQMQAEAQADAEYLRFAAQQPDNEADYDLWLASGGNRGKSPFSF